VGISLIFEVVSNVLSQRALSIKSSAVITTLLHTSELTERIQKQTILVKVDEGHLALESRKSPAKERMLLEGIIGRIIFAIKSLLSRVMTDLKAGVGRGMTNV